eukprot:scaffold13879_cov61-Phaeocystis_antarctica.AAC.4
MPPTHHRRLLDNIFTAKDDLQTAVQAYNANVASAEATYGPLADWDVSGISDMSYLFYNLKNFNADVSNWETSGVTNMSYMFQVRSTPALCPQPPAGPTPCTLLAPDTLHNHELPVSGRVGVQPAAEPRHVKRHEHALHVLLRFGVQPAAQPRHVQRHGHGRHVWGGVGVQPAAEPRHV